MTAQRKKSVYSKDELKKYREILHEKRAELLGVVQQMEDEAMRAGSDEVSVDHMADHGSDSFEQDQTIGLIERESAAVRAIDLALKRIDEGTYGLCEECEAKIKKPRLKAIPSARLCLECKMAEEEGRL
jgi:RNA polymerase-binding protein DksA